MPDNSASFAIQLPNSMPSLGNVLQSGIALNERRSERADALAERSREFDQRNQLAQQQKERDNRLYNLKQIQDATAQKQFDTPNQKVNTAITNELKNIYDQALPLVGESPEYVSMFIRDKIQNASKWHDMAVADANRIEKGTMEFNKTVPNTDLNQITGLATQKFENNYFDQKGQLKAPHLISQGVNYLQDLDNPNVLANVVNNTEPLFKRLQGIPTQSVGDKQYVNKKGQVKSTSWSGLQTPFSQMEEDANGNPIMSTKFSEIAPIKDENGRAMRVADPELEKYILADPAAKAAAYASFEQEKKQKGLNVTDEATNNILFKNYLYRVADKYIPHGVKTADIEKTPAPRITVNVGGAESDIRNIWKGVVERVRKTPEGKLTPLNELSPTAQQELVKMANQIAGKKDESLGTPYTNADIAIKKESDGTINLRKVVRDADGNIKSFDEIITPLNETAINLPAQANSKAKVAVVAKENAQAKKGNSYTINGKAYSHDELLKMGYKDNQIAEALKLGTIKHK